MPDKRLLILGGNRYNLPSIRAARQAGFFTIVADRNPAAPGLQAGDVGWPIDLVDVEALQAAIEKAGGVDGIVAMAEVGVCPAAELSARLGLASISEHAAANATSKAAMRRLWAPLGQFSTGFRVVQRLDQARAAAAELGFPLVFKPDRSFGGSRGVRIVEREDDVADAFDFARSGGRPGSDLVVERRLRGTEHSTEVLIWEGQTSVLCIGQKVKSPEPYRVDLSVQYPAELPAEQEVLIAQMCERAVAALGLTQGVAHVEFCLTEAGPVLMELGARCGGGHTPQIARHVSGVDEFIEYCRMACGLPLSRFRPTARRGADYRFTVFPPGIFESVDIPPALCADLQLIDVGVTLQRGDEIRPLRTTADRAGFVVACGESRQQAVRAADEACKRITVHYVDRSTRPAYTLSDLVGWTV
jgi:biotin carboxylase